MGGHHSSTTEKCSEINVPMWVVKISDFLSFSDWPSHEELKKQGRLWKRTKEFSCIFVSHQWLGYSHPDPQNEQLPVLQKALRNILKGLHVSTDVASQFFGDRKVLSNEERLQLKDAYIWLDWFSVPQIMEAVPLDKLDGDFGTESMPTWALSPKSVGTTFSRMTSMTTQELVISSIPLFVEACDFFVVLVPAATHTETMQRCNFSTWLSRGWCRCEMWCNMLSDSEIPVVVIKGEHEVELGAPFPMMDRPPHEGEFSVSADRDRIIEITERALSRKLVALELQERWDLHRFYVARKEILLDQPRLRRTTQQFLADFHFDSVESASKMQKGLGPVVCAVICCDESFIPFFATASGNAVATLNQPTHARIEHTAIGLWPPLGFALELSWRYPDVTRTLLECRADPNHVDSLGFHVMGGCKTIEMVDMMVEYNADVNHTTSPAHFPALSLACARCAPPDVIRKLIEIRGDVNPESRGICSPHPLSNLAVWSSMNPHCVEAAQVLLEAKSDINLRHEAKGIFHVIELVSRAKLQLVGSSSALVHFYAEWTTTPLGFACFFGGEHLVEFLLQHDADPEIPNARGHTPFELACGHSVLKVIRDYQEVLSI